MNFTSYCTVHLIQNLEPNSLPVLAMKGSITLYVRLDCTRFIYVNLTFSDDLPNSYILCICGDGLSYREKCNA